MPEQSESLYLQDILESGRAIHSYVENIGFTEFAAQREHNLMTLKAA